MKQLGLILMILLGCSNTENTNSSTPSHLEIQPVPSIDLNAIQFPEWAEVDLRLNENNFYGMRIEILTTTEDAWLQLEEILDILPFSRAKVTGITLVNAERIDLKGVDTLVNLKDIGFIADGEIKNISLIEDLSLVSIYIEKNISNAPDFSLRACCA